MTTTPEEFLAHHGVKGMKWGVRKRDDGGGRSKASPEERVAANKVKAEKYHTRAAEAQRMTKELDELGITSPAMKKQYGKAVEHSDFLFAVTHGKSKNKAVAQTRSDLKKKADRAVKDAEAKERGGLSRGQKMAIAGAVIGGGLLVAYGVKKYPDIVTANAKAGEKISPNNFMKRYSKRAEAYKYVPVTKSVVDKMDTLDVVIPKGTVFQRLTAYQDEDLSRRLYTTHTEADNDKYAGLYGPVLRRRTDTADLYLSKMTTGTDIKSPSERKRYDIFRSLIEDDKDARDFTEGLIPPTKENGFDVVKFMGVYLPTDERRGKRSTEEIAALGYNAFSRELVNPDAPAVDKYFDRVKKAGYNALVDENDAKQLSDLPIILIDAPNSVSSREFVPLTPEMEKQARKRLTEIL